ncbi:hypothetical protein ACHAXN_001860 [Cyclotella atomus]|jgi:hypothetical protein
MKATILNKIKAKHVNRNSASFGFKSTLQIQGMKTLNLRMYCHPSKNEHSYYVGHDSGGLSERLSTVTVDPTISFLELREKIEEKELNGVKKRTIFYTEFIHFMQRCPNPLGYQDKESLTSYRIGLLNIVEDTYKLVQPSADDIVLVQEDEETKPICEVVSDLLSTDLVLIPKTQIHPHTGKLADKL